MDWETRLHHIRWVRLILLMEKWLSLLFLGFFFVLGVPSSWLVFLAVLLFGTYFACHNHYHTLEDAGGLPSNHLVLRY